MLPDLGRTLISSGAVSLARQDAPGALHYAGAALTLAAPRGMRLVHTDALVLRGRARLLDARPDGASRARDDADEALRLARECGYAWGERDALFLNADAAAALATSLDRHGDAVRATRERNAANRARDEANAVASKLVLRTAELENAEANAESLLRKRERKSPLPTSRRSS
jgi:hypothetical protein